MGWLRCDREDDGIHPQALRGQEELAGGVHRELLLVRLRVRARALFIGVGKSQAGTQSTSCGEIFLVRADDATRGRVRLGVGRAGVWIA